MFLCNLIRTTIVVGYLALTLVDAELAGQPPAYLGAIFLGLLVMGYDAWERRHRA